MSIRLDSRIQYLKGVGPRRAEQLARLGITTVLDLLFHFPVRYEDRRNILPIEKLQEGEIQTVAGKIVSACELRRGRGRRMFRIGIKDETGTMSALWFSVKGDYLVKKYKIGLEVIASGKAAYSSYNKCMEMTHPDIEPIGESEEEPTGKLLPIYPLTDGLSQKAIQGIIDGLLDLPDLQLKENMPSEILKKLKLPPRNESVRMLHRPDENESGEKLNLFQTDSHRRIIFEELFFIECAVAILRNKNIERNDGVRIKADEESINKIIESLPFQLTEDQLRTLNEIFADLESTHPMNRLLQGDVGCGKTVVAATVLTIASLGGWQGALMAPTEILAEQHFSNINKMKKSFPIKSALLTSGMKQSEKDKIRESVASGEIELLIGTHAVIQDSVAFKNLGMVVIDEQHRFGVRQRSSLMLKGDRPNTLIMTATPIPRTLAMTLYGDLDISVIKTMPKGRGAIETTVITPGKMAKAHLTIHREVKKGRQVYIIYPLVEESEKIDLKAAKEMHEVYEKKIFPDLKVGLVHGRMRQEEKNLVMHAFKEREIDILVSTTVVEVGIDQPNATVMMIEHAERFGLAQLHQLRGRVGRGEGQSHCLLTIEYPLSDIARERLKVMTKTTDGFVIAEKDLELRGTGDLFGVRQSGLPSLRLANLIRDIDLLMLAKKEAFDYIKSDPELTSEESKPLRREMERNWHDRFKLADVG